MRAGVRHGNDDALVAGDQTMGRKNPPRLAAGRVDENSAR
jgi:hypothetical protein